MITTSFSFKGHDSQAVLSMLIEVSGRCRLVTILGNHVEQMLRARDDAPELKWWMEFGGVVTLDS